MKPGFHYCGVVDEPVSASFSSRGRPRQPKSRGKWNKKELTWAIVVHHPDLQESMTRQALVEVFGRTEDICGLKFYQVGRDADIRIQFNYIDGHGGTLGRAHYPLGGPTQGKIQLDEAELWGISQLISVSLHELGHSLGLTHSPSIDDLMYGTAVDPNPIEWQPGDIKRLQHLYGKPTIGRPPIPPPDPPAQSGGLWAAIKSLFSWA